MADRNQLKVADRHGIADDDPFAELTRIMGFDPRQPVRPQPPVQVVPPEPAQDAFDIDLEKELMGEFIDLDGETPVAGDDVSAAATDAGSSWPSAGIEPAGRADDDADFDFDAAMDEEVAASFRQDFQVEEAGAPEPSVEASFEDAPVDEMPAPSPEFYAGQQPEPGEADYAVSSAQDDGDRFDDLAADDLAAEPHEAVASESDGPESEAYVLADADGFEAGDDAGTVGPTEAAGPVTGATEDDFATYFDDAMADADGSVAHEVMEPSAQDDTFELDDAAFSALADEPADSSAYDVAGEAVAEDSVEPPVLDTADADLTAASHSGHETIRSYAEEHAVHRADAEEHDAAAEEAHFADAFEEVFASDLAGDQAPEPIADAVEPVAAAVAAEPVPVWPVAAQPSASRESTLEDELNALLSRMTARPAIPDPLQPAAASRADDGPAAASAMQPQHHHDDAHEGLDAALLADLQALDFGDLADEPDATHVSGSTGEAAAEPASRQAGETNWSWSRGTPLAPPAAPPAPVQASAPAAVQPQPFSATMSAPAYVPEASGAELGSAQPAQTTGDVPDVETVDVPERVVALADDLDLPELTFEQDQPEASPYDDLDTEFSSLLNEMNSVEAAPAAVAAPVYEDDAYGGFSQAQRADAYQVGAAGTGRTAASDFDAFGLPGNPPRTENDALAADELDYDPETSETSTLPDMVENDAPPRRRGLLVAAVIGAVAVVGGLGAYALSPGGKGSGDAPAIVKADNQPIKVKPENPGGTVIPNQNNKVYDAVGRSAKPSEPTQQKLVTDVEEPMDVAAKQPESRVVDLSPAAGADEAAAPMPKSEDRIEQAAAQDDAGKQDAPVVTPRKVRTMVVKPDGSLVPREDPAPAKVAATEPADPAPQHVDLAGDQTGAVAAPSSDDAKPVEAKAKSSATPSVAPIAPQRPSDQPVDVVGEVKPDQVAALDQNAAAGSWAMQIASQPTAESAQKTYQDLARRYGSVLQGHDVNIVKAEIAGKGTFYRVRIPAGSRNDAVALCTSYKAAGGNCFVSK